MVIILCIKRCSVIWNLWWHINGWKEVMSRDVRAASPSFLHDLLGLTLQLPLATDILSWSMKWPSKIVILKVSFIVSILYLNPAFCDRGTLVCSHHLEVKKGLPNVIRCLTVLIYASWQHWWHVMFIGLTFVSTSSEVSSWMPAHGNVMCTLIWQDNLFFYFLHHTCCIVLQANITADTNLCRFSYRV